MEPYRTRCNCGSFVGNAALWGMKVSAAAFRGAERELVSKCISCITAALLSQCRGGLKAGVTLAARRMLHGQAWGTTTATEDEVLVTLSAAVLGVKVALDSDEHGACNMMLGTVPYERCDVMGASVFRVRIKISGVKLLPVLKVKFALLPFHLKPRLLVESEC